MSRMMCGAHTYCLHVYHTYILNIVWHTLVSFIWVTHTRHNYMCDTYTSRMMCDTHTCLVYKCDTHMSRIMCDTHTSCIMCDAHMCCWHVWHTHVSNLFETHVSCVFVWRTHVSFKCVTLTCLVWTRLVYMCDTHVSNIVSHTHVSFTCVTHARLECCVTHTCLVMCDTHPSRLHLWDARVSYDVWHTHTYRLGAECIGRCTLLLLWYRLWCATARCTCTLLMSMPRSILALLFRMSVWKSSVFVCGAAVKLWCWLMD